MSPDDDPLAGFPVVLEYSVQWGDMDSMGHVNNTIYFRWFESARIEYFRRLDKLCAARDRTADEADFILAACACNYRRQLTFPDTIRVGARITRLGRSSMTMENAIVSRELKAVAADGDSTLVMFNYKANASYPMPDDVRRAIEKLEGRKLENR